MQMSALFSFNTFRRKWGTGREGSSDVVNSWLHLRRFEFEQSEVLDPISSRYSVFLMIMVYPESV